MDSRDFFRRFFGFPDRHPSTFDDRNHRARDSESHRNGRDDDRGFFFGNSSRGLEGMFEHFHTDMQRQMEGLHREMEEMMKGFGAIDFHSVFQPPQIRPLDPDVHGIADDDNPQVFVWSNVPSPFFGQTEKKSPRDFMLKDGADEDFVAGKPALPAPPSATDRPKPVWTGPIGKGDSDLDGKISEDKLLEMIKKPNEGVPARVGPSINKPHYFSSGKSVKVSTTRGPNNRVEQTRVVKDSSGLQETTVTRSIGDKSYTVTTITDKNGKHERHEKFNNMDESDVARFQEEWNNKPKQDSWLTPKSDTGLDGIDQNLFSKLFGWRR